VKFQDILSYNITLGHNPQMLEHQLQQCESLRSQEKSCLFSGFHNSKLTTHAIKYKNLTQDIYLNLILSAVSQYERLRVL
jgi:hypothetical protein